MIREGTVAEKGYIDVLQTGTGERSSIRMSENTFVFVRTVSEEIRNEWKSLFILYRSMCYGRRWRLTWFIY